MDNQFTDERYRNFIREFNSILDKKQPDVIGLNEVLLNSNTSKVKILDWLKTKGYVYQHFAEASPLNNEFNIGCAIAYKYKINNLEEFVICKDTPARRRGFAGHEITAIDAVINFGDREIRYIVAHPIVFTHFTYRDHFESTKNLKNRVKNNKSNMIIAGDFNESRFWPKSFKRMSKDLNCVTGSLKLPTWKFQRGVIDYDTGSLLKAEDSRFYSLVLGPARLNLDHIYWSKNSNLKLIDFKVLNTDISDHRPLFAEFEV